MKIFRGGIMGAPAAGKGTISAVIIKNFDVVHISTGDLLRQNVAENTELGKSAQKYMSSGKLVPDVLILKIVLERLKALEERNWLCDGFPRTLVQAEKLFMSYPLDLVINLKVPFDLIISRVQARRVHPGSGRVYNLTYQPPKEADKDDETGEPLIQRSDDHPEVVRKRLEVYEKTAAPLIEFYRKKGILREYTGTTIEEIWPGLRKELLRFMDQKT